MTVDDLTRRLNEVVGGQRHLHREEKPGVRCPGTGVTEDGLGLR